LNASQNPLTFDFWNCRAIPNGEFLDCERVFDGTVNLKDGPKVGYQVIFRHLKLLCEDMQRGSKTGQKSIYPTIQRVVYVKYQSASCHEPSEFTEVGG